MIFTSLFNFGTLAILALAIVIVLSIIRSIRIVPQQRAYIVERLGKYKETLHAGFHILFPFIDKVSYSHTLKEEALDVLPQICITKDNISVEVDGILYLQIIDPMKASYGINNYKFASAQLAQTTMRSIIGKLELDRSFEERESINAKIVEAVDTASDPWGVKVTRYEIKNIVPPGSIKEAMEKQMKAEREKRAVIAESEGKKQATINIAEGDRQETISRSEGEMQKRINEAKGHAEEITQVAFATAAGIRKIASAIGEKGGHEAVHLRVAEQYIAEFGKIAQTNNTLIVPANVSDISGMIATAMKVMKSIEPSSKK